MVGHIKVSTDVLVSTSNRFGEQNNKVSQLTRQMLQQVNSLNGIWQGEAQRSYCSKFQKLEHDMDQMRRMIDEHVTELKQMAQNYAKSEEKNTSSFNALKDDYISG